MGGKVNNRRVDSVGDVRGVERAGSSGSPSVAESPARRRRSRGGEQGEEQGEEATSSRGGNEAVNFTIFCETKRDPLYVELQPRENVQTLKTFIESGIGIPVTSQVICWPGLEPRNDTTLLRELELEREVSLIVTSKEMVCQSVIEDSGVVNDGRSPSTSGQQQRPGPVQPVGGNFRLNVQDAENDEQYDELLFDGNKTVRDVKNYIADLTTIPVQEQVWSGWPDGVSDEKMLNVCGLSLPYHSFVLMRTQALTSYDFNTSAIPDTEASSLAAEAIGETESVTIVSTNTEFIQGNASPGKTSDEAQAVADTPTNVVQAQTPGPSKARTARKSTTKGALNAIYRQTERQNLGGERSNGSTLGSAQENDDTENGGVGVHEVSSPSCINSQHLNILNDILLDYDQSPGRKRAVSDSSPMQTPKKSRRDSDYAGLSQSPKKRSSLTFLRFGEEENKMIVNCLLNYLDPLSQLSLRRVCKTTMKWIPRDTFSFYEEEKWKNFRLRITGQDIKTFETAVNLSLPITSFIFEVDGEWFYESDDLESFINYLSFRVKNLILQKFFMFQNHNERRLFQAFQNLEKLTLNDLVVNNTESAFQQCPSTLANLQVLKLNYEINAPQNNMLLRPKSWDFTWSMLSDCESLMYFRFPRVCEEKGCNPLSQADGIFAPLLDYIQMRQRSGGVAIEYLDLKHFNNTESNYVHRFVDLLRKCYSRDIKLKNVNSLVIQEVVDDEGAYNDAKFKFCENILSLINYCPFIVYAPLQNLEKIVVDVYPSITDYEPSGRQFKNIFWQELRVIKIKDTFRMKRDELSLAWHNWQEIQEDLYGSTGVFDRGRVKYIKIDSPSVPYFLSEGRLAQKFYNLTKLEIVSWYEADNPSTLNRRLISIWKRLHLEELRIENCPALSDSSFIEPGEDDDSSEGRPAFLNLIPTLKKMTLGLDGTSVTERSLKKVFSRMKLKTFIILSSVPVNIAEAGLLKLLNGVFGKHIERFPFDCWSSSKIDPGRFARLAKMFRSMR